MSGTTYDPTTHEAYEVPEPPYTGRNLRRAFERGFDSYVWAEVVNRTVEVRNRRAIWRYHLTSMREAFCEGWNAADRVRVDKREKSSEQDV
jgi:hypothetical protein